MSVKIIADSTCDLSEELLKKYHISILPLHIVLGENEYKDGFEISPEEIYQWSDANKEAPKTSAASIADAIDLYKTSLEHYDEIAKDDYAKKNFHRQCYANGCRRIGC